MAWIESHQGLERHPKTIMLCSLMNWDLDACIGKLHRFWWWCLEYCPDGNISRQPAEVIVQSLGLSADSQPTVSRQSAEMSLHNFWMAGFLDKTIEGDLLIHDWLTYVGRYLRDTKYKRQPEKLAAIKKMYEEVELVSRQSADSRRYQPTNLPNPTKPDPLKPSCPKPEPILDDEAVRLSKLLAEGILKNNPNNVTLNNGKRDHTVKTWAKDIDKLHRIDGQKYPDIEKVIRWTQRDEFWSKNILSARKLRKQWDQLWVKANDPSRKKTFGTPERLNADSYTGLYEKDYGEGWGVDD